MVKYRVAIQQEFDDMVTPQTYKVEMCVNPDGASAFYVLGKVLLQKEALTVALTATRVLLALDPECEVEANRPF